ncbi:MAG TPA: type IV pilus modification protein PilV [Pseudomonadales bacterium]
MRSAQGGYSLIEVAIGILVLTVGILGMATMQITAKRLNYDALQRSIATTLAHDIVERMRINEDGIDIYVVTNLGGGSLGDSPAKDCAASSCNFAELAAYDLWQWEQALDGATEINSDGQPAGGLFNPRACISNDDRVVTIAIAWRGFQKTGNPDISDCGEGEGLYETDDELRQVMVLTTFI